MAVVKINAVQVPEGGGVEMEKRFAARAGAVDSAKGFLGFELLRPVAGDDRYFVYTRWETEEDYQAWAAAAMGNHAGGRPVGTGSTLLEFEVVVSAQPRSAH